ncbi:MAG: hypothetical protein MR473_10970, partial [Clostridiales bacterium]|nr:hypothetical protein [Clostridiales bacterium]
VMMVDLLYGISLLLCVANDANDRIRGTWWWAEVITSLVLGLSLVVHWFLCRRNMEVPPGAAARFLSGLLSLLIVFGSIADILLIFTS